ncbi:MAG: DUF4349 domain-containing protein [Chloroflexi bacterium]|nr:DUF4349 domain-containing protein [Chloroflexota bacterium]
MAKLGTLLCVVAGFLFVASWLGCARAAPALTSVPSRPVAVPTAERPPTPRPELMQDQSKESRDSGATGVVEGLLVREASLLEQRVIVRTVDLELVVPDVLKAIEDVSAVAVRLGGWVVAGKQQEKNSGSISIRVPSLRVDEALRAIRSLAAKVEAETSTSQDFTDEYVDTQARVSNLRATEAALVKILEKAQTVQDALLVQTELTKVRGEIETAQGRLKFLEQTAAFSLINMGLKLPPSSMVVDAGVDRMVMEGAPGSFRASFTPPPWADDFDYVWDFGDGSEPVTGTRTALTIDGQGRVTATVSHTYKDATLSPLIVTVKMRGRGEAGLVEGSDTVIVSVRKVPRIEVYAGDDVELQEGQQARFLASFTRPEGLKDFRFTWDFGDGSETLTGSILGEATTSKATHVYPNYRPMPFTVTFTVKASSEAGPVSESVTLRVTVTQAIPWVINLRPYEAFRTAVSVFTSVLQGLGILAIWIGVFSPLVGGGWMLRRFVRRRRRSGRTSPTKTSSESGPTE